MAKNVAVSHGRFGRVAVLQMQCALVVHAHMQAHLLFNIGDVPASFTVRERDMRLDQDHYVAVNPWESHAYPHLNRESPLILALYIDPAWLARLKPGGRFTTSETVMTPEIRRIVHLLHAEILYGEGSDGDFIEELIDELLGVTLSGSGQDIAKGPARSVSDFRIRRSIDYMRKHVGGRCDMADLAHDCGLSREHFFVRFQDETELTPLVYWNMLKMQQALDGLTRSRAPVGDIAYDLGFSAPGNFTRFFVRHQGVGPLDYRRASQTPVMI